MNITSAVKTARNIITANSPVLLVGAAITGVVTTGVLAAKGGYKARGIIDWEDKQRELNDEPALTTQEKVQLTWLCYAIPAVTGASSIAAIVGTHTIHTKRANAMAAIYALTSNRLDDVSEKAEELLGTKKAQQLKNEVAQAQVDREGPIVDNEILLIGDGAELCHDAYTGRYFMSSMASIEQAVNAINRKLVEDGEASLNDFYDQIGLSPIPSGTQFGWSGYSIEAKFGGIVTSDGRPAVSFWFSDAPKDNLGCP